MKFKCETYIEIEWPPRTRKAFSIQKVDKGEWFTVDEAKKKINPSEAALINELISKIV